MKLRERIAIKKIKLNSVRSLFSCSLSPSSPFIYIFDEQRIIAIVRTRRGTHTQRRGQNLFEFLFFQLYRKLHYFNIEYSSNTKDKRKKIQYLKHFTVRKNTKNKATYLVDWFRLWLFKRYQKRLINEKNRLEESRKVSVKAGIIWRTAMIGGSRTTMETFPRAKDA